MLQAGSFTSDGQGNITNGLMDSNSASGVHTKLPFTGTYSLDTTNTGPMTLVIPALGTFSYQLAVPASGTIRFIQNGSAGGQGTGVIRKVATTTGTKITVSSLAATWAFGSFGADSALSRFASAGTFVASSTGAWTSGVEDTNDHGSVSNSLPFTGSFVAIDPLTGRGTATLSVTNGATTNYSFYPVSSSELIMLGIDPVSSTAPLDLLTLDTSTAPIGGWTNAALNFTTVAELQGVALSNGNLRPRCSSGLADLRWQGRPHGYHGREFRWNSQRQQVHRYLQRRDQRADDLDRLRQLFNRLLPVIECCVHGGRRRDRDRRNHRSAVRDAVQPTPRSAVPTRAVPSSRFSPALRSKPTPPILTATAITR